MKLAKINHVRCGEYSACTLVWVRDSLTAEELDERVYAAEKEYLEVLAAFRDSDKPQKSVPYQPEWEKHRDRNVGEVLDEHRAARAASEEFKKKRNEALKTFDRFLEKQEGVTAFWDAEFDLEGEVDWGHRHGVDIQYGETDWPRFRLLKATKRGRPGGSVTIVEEDEEWL